MTIRTKRALVVLALVSCSPAVAPPIETKPLGPAAPSASASSSPLAKHPAQPAMDAKDQRQITRTLARVSELRGLKAKKDVPGKKLARVDLVGHVKEKALREYPADALKREGQLLQLMGFAPATFDYMGETLKLLESQLEGLYEPLDGTMYLAAELEGDEAKATLAHELVHALQDQYWDLKSRSTYHPGEGDKSLALAALAEGDATSVMLDFMMMPDRSAVDLEDDQLREMMEGGMATSGDLATIPHILKTSLVAPYIEGIQFVHKMRRKGGWTNLDKAWERTPVSSEQILHIDKWEANEAPITIPVPSSKALGGSFKKEDEDTFGELGFALSYGEWMEPDEARKIAAGWGGDRTAMYVDGEKLAIAVHERYDAGGPNGAERALKRLATALKKHVGAAAIDNQDVVCIDRKDLGPLLFAKKDRDFVMIAGPATVGAKVWTSASTCSQAKKWADEILAQK